MFLVHANIRKNLHGRNAKKAFLCFGCRDTSYALPEYRKEIPFPEKSQQDTNPFTLAGKIESVKQSFSQQADTQYT